MPHTEAGPLRIQRDNWVILLIKQFGLNHRLYVSECVIVWLSSTLIAWCILVHSALWEFKWMFWWWKSPLSEIETQYKLKERRKQHNRHQPNSCALCVSRWFVCGIRISGSTRRVGLMAQSVQVNYSLSWEEAQTEKITSVQFVEHSFRVSWRAHYVSWAKGEQDCGIDGVLREAAGTNKAPH